jgi:excinuclease ABC subunit C
MRDEAHRFGITHHRKRREKGSIRAVLTEIPGVGFSTNQKLLWKFRSVKNIRNASLDELRAVIGQAKANVIHQYFHKDEKESGHTDGPGS